jgi:hypothetical protein
LAILRGLGGLLSEFDIGHAIFRKSLDVPETTVRLKKDFGQRCAPRKTIEIDSFNRERNGNLTKRSAVLKSVDSSEITAGFKNDFDQGSVSSKSIPIDAFNRGRNDNSRK